MKTLGNITISIAIAFLAITIFRPELVDRATQHVLGSGEVSSSESLEAIPSKIQPFIPTSVVEYLQTIRLATNKFGATSSGGEVTAESIIEATNQERINAGLEPFAINNELMRSASTKTADMISRQYFEHTSPSGADIRSLANQVGYDYIKVGENLAYGNDFRDGADVVEEWMKSPGHRANMLNPDYHEIGVAVMQGMYEGREVWFAVQHFGTDRSACPLINANLRTSIEAIKDELKARQAQIATEKAVLEAPDHPQGEEYRARVTELNKVVANYNTSLVILKEKIKLYNGQVAAFNPCRDQYLD